MVIVKKRGESGLRGGFGHLVLLGGLIAWRREIRRRILGHTFIKAIYLLENSEDDKLQKTYLRLRRGTMSEGEKCKIVIPPPRL